MASLELDRFKSIMSTFFVSYTDEFWGPILGPGGPHIFEGRFSREPDPVPWRRSRELTVAFEAMKLAEAFEMAIPGSGGSFLQSFADDPDDWCGTRVPGRPRPRGGEQQLDRAVLGAALDYVARGVSHEQLAQSTREIADGMIT